MQENPETKHLKSAYWLSIITIVYNLLEGGIATYFGSHDETLALFGFGVDSFVEVLSGIGILHMITRQRKVEVSLRDKFEITALRITGTAFYILVAGLTLGSILSIVHQSTPHK